MTVDEIQATNESPSGPGSPSEPSLNDGLEQNQPFADAKAAAAHDEMIDKLRGTTALGRLALVEVRTIFAKLAELGYTIVEPNNG